MSYLEEEFGSGVEMITDSLNYRHRVPTTATQSMAVCRPSVNDRETVTDVVHIDLFSLLKPFFHSSSPSV
jgi:hypothetical protein